MGNQILTSDQVRADLDRRGKSIRQAAREIGVSDRVLYELLRGRFIGKRGQSHKAAVMLGMKNGVVE